jgi:hypothetical protein
MLVLLAIPFLALCFCLSRQFGVVGTGMAVCVLEGSFAFWVVSGVMRIFEIQPLILLRWLALPSPNVIRRHAARLAGRRCRPSSPS